MTDFIEWVEEELKNKGWNRNDLSRRSGVDSGHLSRVLNRERGYGPDTVLAIAQALGAPPVLAFQKAGWLPDNDSQARISDIITAYKIDELSQTDKDLVLKFVEFLQDKGEHPDKRTSFTDVKNREGETPPDPIKE